jgi:class 3 adenylate cyclase
MLSADTCAAAGAAILVRQLEPISVKGRALPLPVYQLDGLREPPTHA